MRKFSRHDRGMLSATHIIVGINQERGARWKGLGEGAKGFQLRRECLHKGMGHRAKNGNPEELPRKHIRRSRATSQIGSARTLEPGIRSLRTTQPEFHNWTSLRCLHYPCGLRGNQGLQVDGIEQQGLDNLGFNEIAGHAQHRLIREEHRSLRHGVHIAVESNGLQVRQERRGKEPLRPQILDRVRVER